MRRTGQDRETRTALLASDANTLQRLVAADTLIIGPKGLIINRDTWIGVYQESAFDQLKLEATEAECRNYDNAGIRFDLINSECRYQGETIRGRFRVAQVWVTDHGRWQLASVHTRPPLPDESDDSNQGGSDKPTPAHSLVPAVQVAISMGAV